MYEPRKEHLTQLNKVTAHKPPTHPPIETVQCCCFWRGEEGVGFTDKHFTDMVDKIEKSNNKT